VRKSFVVLFEKKANLTNPDKRIFNIPDYLEANLLFFLSVRISLPFLFRIFGFIFFGQILNMNKENEKKQNLSLQTKSNQNKLKFRFFIFFPSKSKEKELVWENGNSFFFLENQANIAK
jgi:hypothetical protein